MYIRNILRNHTSLKNNLIGFSITAFLNYISSQKRSFLIFLVFFLNCFSIEFLSEKLPVHMALDSLLNIRWKIYGICLFCEYIMKQNVFPN